MTKDCNIKIEDFADDAFEYLSKLEEASVDLSINRYLLEYIANGFVKYGKTPEAFIDHVDDWIRSLVKIYPELGFDHKTNQIFAVIDLTDQLVIVDDELIKSLQYIIDIQDRYGLLITYQYEGNVSTTTIAHFFDKIERLYPIIKERYKGLGESPAKVSKDVITDPRTRRIIRVTTEDALTMSRMGVLVGDSKENVNARKEMLLNFEFDKNDIDN